jgi:caa(3)-type oxidase subunit IV
MADLTASAPGAVAAPAHHGPSYVKTWGILLALLVVSVVGPMLEIRVVTLITAFGVALVKAYIVAKYFMHIDIERRYVSYLLAVMVVLMGLMVAAVSPDVLKHEGKNWENRAAKKSVLLGEKKAAEAAAHGGTHGAAPAAGAAAH